MKTRFTITMAIALAAILFWAGPATPAGATNYGHGGYDGNVYCVRYGETLWGIAMQYGTTAHAIAYANGIMNPNWVRAGMCLHIPSGKGYGGWDGGYGNGGYDGYAKKPVNNGGWDGGYRGGYDNNGGYDNKKVDYGHGGWDGGYSKGCYWVKWGDTLSSIAWQHGTTTWALAKANGIWNQNWIRAGMCLTIPGRGY